MASGIMAPMVDGVLQTHTATGDSLTKKTKNSNVVDSDMFLTLLVAEMQNQDPLEPTSNTEWVSQYATFTQVQQMSEMSQSMDQLRANSLVGKEVIMKVTSASTGEVTYKRGVVEYVQIENGKSILVIDGEQYSIDDLDSVISDEYSDAYNAYSTWIAKFNALPGLQFIDETYENALKELFDDYYAMTDYQQKFMQTYAGDYLRAFSQYLAQLELYGIKFEEPAEDSSSNSTTLDDILNDFNERMDEILEKLGALSNTSGSGMDEILEKLGALSNALDSDKAENKNHDNDTAVSGSDGTTDGNTENSNSTVGSGDAAGENTGNSNGTAGSGDITDENSGDSVGGAEESGNVAGSTDNTEKAGGAGENSDEAGSDNVNKDIEP